MKGFILVILMTTLIFAQDLPIKKSSAKYHVNGALKRIKLTQPAIVQDQPCMRWVWFYETGAINHFQTSKNIVIQDIAIPKYSTVFLREGGVLKAAWLYRDIEIQGYPCTGSSWSKISTGFHTNGTLRYFFPRKSLTIQGFPIKSGGLAGVYFYESGRLHRFYLNKDVAIDGKIYPKGLRLTLDEDGNIIATYKKTFQEKFFPMFS